jgi:hypothetical protein
VNGTLAFVVVFNFFAFRYLFLTKQHPLWFSYLPYFFSARTTNIFFWLASLAAFTKQLGNHSS